MTVCPIVSFLPSVTELLCEFGVQDDLYGVTHECKYPIDATLKPQVINSVIDSDTLTSNEIDTILSNISSSTVPSLHVLDDIQIESGSSVIFGNPALQIIQRWPIL